MKEFKLKIPHVRFRLYSFQINSRKCGIKIMSYTIGCGEKGLCHLSHKGKFEDRVDCFYFNPFDACRLAQAVVN